MHQFVTEVALKEVEVQAVHGYEFRQKHGLELVFPAMAIAEHEATTFCWVSMQVYIHAYLSVVNLLGDGLLDSPDGWLVRSRWVNVVAVKVLPKGIKPIVTSRNAIWIKHWHNFENEFVPQNLRLLTFFVG